MTAAPLALAKRRSLVARFMLLALKLAGVLLIGSVLLVIAYRFIDPPFTPLMIGRWVGARFSGDSTGLDYQWRNIAEISTNLQRAVITSEDRKFLRHNGFDWDAIETNWDRLQEGAKKIKGASTISMQAARNVFLWQGHSYVRKGLEAYFTVLIEFFWTKRRILEVYLNVIEMGDGVYGAEAAARHYYGVPAKVLAPPQAARIASILPSPRKWDTPRPTPYIQRRTAIITRAMMGAALPKK
jgi:monofunctional biosynthetic peptidoglycan transglycosylase